MSNTMLVVGIPTPLKNMKVNGKDYPIYYMGKMFQTTNQNMRIQHVIYRLILWNAVFCSLCDRS